MTQKSAVLLHIRGRVQGVGFRPFVYRRACSLGLTGWVENHTGGVEIWAEGARGSLEQLVDMIRTAPPAPSRVTEILESARHPRGFVSFTIRESQARGRLVTDVSPDIAVCDQCLVDMRTQRGRIAYPLINCTHCGPRFSIIRAMPYDRPNTTMADFPLCPQCESEYRDPGDRRFHAQPVACNVCGPAYALHDHRGVHHDIETICMRLASLFASGGIAAIKGIGGFHLACDAGNRQALHLLRQRKKRYGKPFALMYRDDESAAEDVFLTEEERALLRSPARPIVLARPRRPFPPEISDGLPRMGVMLPYAPFHHLLFSHCEKKALVMTSGNVAEEPVVIDNQDARERLGGIADAIVDYNRAIHNRVDDSVAAVFDGQTMLIRRSRGFTPDAIALAHDAEGILALGGELKNCFAVGKGARAILSQHIGDLANAETYAFFRESLERLTTLLEAKPGMIAHDLHPDYFSTRYARDSDAPCCAVQHHHAHIAAVMAEHGLDEPVIGVAFDGTGYGEDGAIWGGEILLADLERYRRTASIQPFRLPGGDTATRAPWRCALGALWDMCGIRPAKSDFGMLAEVDDQEFRAARCALERSINTPWTSSMGRLFDAVSALLGVCTHSHFEAEAAMRLEAACVDLRAPAYPVAIQGAVIMIAPLLIGMCDDLAAGVAAAHIASRFHVTVAEMALRAVCATAAQNRVSKAVLSGGCFQNACIFTLCRQRLEANGFRVYTPSRVPCNDGGIALGQIAVAAKRRSLSCV